MTFKLRYQITPRYLTAPSKRRSGERMSPGVRFIVAHDTGNPGSSAAANVNYYERSRDEKSASAHLFVDDKEIIECVPALTGPPEKAWHVRYSLPVDDQMFGVNANDAAIGIEYCYGNSIDADAAYEKYVWLTAYAVHRFGLNPARDIVGHFFLDPRRRTDPVTGLAHSRRTYEQLLRDVQDEYWASLSEEPDRNGDAVSIPASGKVRTNVRLNLRSGAPNRRAPIHQALSAGTTLDYARVIEDGEAVNGNPVWLCTPEDQFFWSGGVAWIDT